MRSPHGLLSIFALILNTDSI